MSACRRRAGRAWPSCRVATRSADATAVRRSRATSSRRWSPAAPSTPRTTPSSSTFCAAASSSTPTNASPPRTPSATTGCGAAGRGRRPRGPAAAQRRGRRHGPARLEATQPRSPTSPRPDTSSLLGTVHAGPSSVYTRSLGFRSQTQPLADLGYFRGGVRLWEPERASIEGGLGLRENEIWAFVARIWLEDGHKTTSK